MNVESGNYSSGISASVEIPNNWDITWKNKLAQTHLKELSDMLFSWGAMRDVPREKVMDIFFKIADKRSEVLNALRNASWSYYCQNMAPILRELDKITEEIILCDGPQRRSLELRIESIKTWTEWRDN